MYKSACGNNQDFVCSVCDGKGSYSHAKVDPVININISGQLFSNTRSVSQLWLDRIGIDLLTRVKTDKENKKKKKLLFFYC